MAGVVVVGSYNRDVVLRVARFPAPGETCLSLGRMETSGGKGSNQAIMAARCGAQVEMLAAVGRDGAGEAALALWAAQGIGADGVARLADAGTGMAMILVDDAGENLIVVDAGANARFSPAHAEAASGRLANAALVVAQLETPPETTAAAFALARRGGARTLLNAAPATALDAVDGLLAATDILVVNTGAGEALTGASGIAAAGEALLVRVAEAVVVTAGAEPATLFRRDAPPATVRPPAIRPVDTTGAGDAFIGAFAARLVEAGDMEDALAWGVVAGALACTRPGAAASYADRAELAAAVADARP